MREPFGLWVLPTMIVALGVPLLLAFLISPQPGVSRTDCIAGLGVIAMIVWVATKVLDVRINRQHRLAEPSTSET